MPKTREERVATFIKVLLKDAKTLGELETCALGGILERFEQRIIMMGLPPEDEEYVRKELRNIL